MCVDRGDGGEVCVVTMGRGWGGVGWGTGAGMGVGWGEEMWVSGGVCKLHVNTKFIWLLQNMNRRGNILCGEMHSLNLKF